MNGSVNQSLPDICTDLFSFALYLRESQNFERPDDLYDKVLSLFSSMEGKARSANVPDVDIWDAKYALAAFIDETVRWESRLELEFFNSNLAGEEFFNKLEQIRKEKGREGVLKVYYLCLTLGFEGRYVRAPERLQEYIREFQQAFGSKGVEKLSPSGDRPREKVRRGGGVPAWVPWAFAGISVVAVLCVVFILRISIKDWATGVMNQIESFLG